MWKKKQCPVLYDKQIKWYSEKDVVSNVWNVVAKDLEFIENGSNKLMLFFMFYVGYRVFGRWKESGGLYLPGAKIIRWRGWKNWKC